MKRLLPAGVAENADADVIERVGIAQRLPQHISNLVEERLLLSGLVGGQQDELDAQRLAAVQFLVAE